MTGYWPTYFFFRVYEPRSGERTRPASTHLHRTSLVNKGNFFLRDTAGSPERARWSYLAHMGSQSQHRISFILPVRGASRMINCLITSKQKNLESFTH